LDLGLFTNGRTETFPGQSNIGATSDDDVQACHFVPESGAWYKLNVDFPAIITVSTCNQANFDTQIAMYSGDCANLICQAGVNNNDGCDKTIRIINVVGSTDIYILVNGVGGATGNFDLTVSVTRAAPKVSWWQKETNSDIILLI